VIARPIAGVFFNIRSRAGVTEIIWFQWVAFSKLPGWTAEFYLPSLSASECALCAEPSLSVYPIKSVPPFRNSLPLVGLLVLPKIRVAPDGFLKLLAEVGTVRYGPLFYSLHECHLQRLNQGRSYAPECGEGNR
jgi:hypothetical protein